MAWRILLAASLLALVVVASLACTGRRIHAEAVLVESELTKSAVGDLERTVKQGVSKTDRDIQIVTIVFLIDQPVFKYRDQANAYLLDRGYTQSMNLSTPTEFSIAYNGPEGLIYIEVMAEVALPPVSLLTGLPETAPPTPDGASPPPATSPDESTDDGAEPPPPAPDFHRVTIKISY